MVSDKCDVHYSLLELDLITVRPHLHLLAPQINSKVVIQRFQSMIWKCRVWSLPSNLKSLLSFILLPCPSPVQENRENFPLLLAFKVCIQIYLLLLVLTRLKIYSNIYVAFKEKQTYLILHTVYMTSFPMCSLNIQNSVGLSVIIG